MWNSKFYQCFDYSWRFLLAAFLTYTFQHIWYHSTFFFALTYHIDNWQNFAYSKMIHKHKHLMPPTDNLMFHLISIWIWFIYLKSFVKPRTVKDLMVRGVGLYNLLAILLMIPSVLLEEKHEFILAHGIVYALCWTTISGCLLLKKCRPSLKTMENEKGGWSGEKAKSD